MHILTGSCVLLLWMCTLTFVKSQECTREAFVKSPLYDSNFDVSSLEERYDAGKQVRVNCNIGYSGFYRILCSEGKWLPRGTKCQPKQCGHPGDAQFADFQLEKGDDFVFGSKVVYTCQKGYQMISRRNFRNCMADGWDGVVPVCEALRCPPLRVDNNVQVFGDTEEATFGNVARFSCKGSREILEGPKEVYCDEAGVWSDESPKCTAVKCKVPEIANGLVNEPAQEYYEDEVLHFECDDRYKRVEERPSRCIKTGQRADWSPTPGCERIKCKLDLPPISGTSYTPEYTNVFLPGERVKVTCGEKFSIRQAETADVLCLDDGQWTMQPVCQVVTCVRRAPHVVRWYPNWGSSRIDDTVTYYCESGFKKPAGVTKATCTRGGWSPEKLCEEITCAPKMINNAEITNYKQLYKDGDRADYDCKEGFKGRFSIYCTETGWSEHGRCDAITCNRHIDPNADNQNLKPVYNYNEQVEYVCKKDRRRFTLTCGENGWSRTSPCPAATCDKHIDPDATIQNPKPVYNYNDRVEYVCKEGGERFTLTCTEKGWDGNSRCSAAKCQKAELDNGFVVGPFNDTVFYSCNENYKPMRSGWWGEAKCNDKREWVGLQRCIEKTSCAPLVIPNAKVTSESQNPVADHYSNNTSVRITCDEGYTSEIVKATCKNGKWDVDLKSQICKPTQFCQPPRRVENAAVQGPYQRQYQPGATITYVCREDYTKSGEDTIQCNNGEWTKKLRRKDMTCTRKDATQ